MTNILEENRQLINSIIKEELGINKKVKKEANNLFEQILSKLKITNKKIIANGVGHKNFSSTKEIFGEKIHIIVNQFNFSDKGIYNGWVKKEGVKDSCSIDLDNRFFSLYIYIYSISGYIEKDQLIDSIFHELNHLFQQINAQKMYPNSQIYSKAYSNLKSNIKEKQIPAYIIYISQTSEQDSFANGLYGYLTQNMVIKPTINDISKSPAYERLTELKNDIKFIENNKDNKLLINSLKEYNLDIDYLLKIANNALNSFLRKIGKTIIKVKEDFLSEGVNFTVSTRYNANLDFFLE